jgi:lipopolysaccharide/colanic/teichoic acid biosynthesis glycosyltransferase
MAILSLRGNYNATSIQERIIPELEYVERQSIWLDMQLILRTIYWWLRMGHVKGSF